jgi:hypothetical protein
MIFELNRRILHATLVDMLLMCKMMTEVLIPQFGEAPKHITRAVDAFARILFFILEKKKCRALKNGKVM